MAHSMPTGLPDLPGDLDLADYTNGNGSLLIIPMALESLILVCFLFVLQATYCAMYMFMFMFHVHVHVHVCTCT